ncbi:MAG TPA: hypothetical protein VGR07_18955, partial [Thermoanaerobaculia bacterium]|nr:hypothetical protein [Thermoanaerobaculia bacterium]
MNDGCLLPEPRELLRLLDQLVIQNEGGSHMHEYGRLMHIRQECGHAGTPGGPHQLLLCERGGSHRVLWRGEEGFGDRLARGYSSRTMSETALALERMTDAAKFEEVPCPR